MTPYEIIEHTADIGLRIHGENPAALFSHSAEGFFHLITDISNVQTRCLSSGETVHEIVRLQADDTGNLLLKWLRELLFLFSAKGLVFWKYNFIELGENRLEVKLEGGCFDAQRDEQKYEIKAVTYHGFKLMQTPEEWTAEIIFDI